MKRFLLVMLIVLLCGAAQVCALADGNYFPEDTYAVVNNPNASDMLNLREHPSMDDQSLGRYYNGTQVRLVAEYEGSPEWVYVQIGQGAGSAEGFMLKAYLAMDPVNTAVLPVHPTYTVQAADGEQLVALDSVMRVKQVLSTLPAGTQVVILGYMDGWYHVQVGGRIGYIQRNEENAALTQPAADTAEDDTQGRIYAAARKAAHSASTECAAKARGGFKLQPSFASFHWASCQSAF